MEQFLRDAAKLQSSYFDLKKERKLSKRAMCDLCVPFRDKYHLSDVQCLRIARREVCLETLISWYDEVVKPNEF